MKFFNVLAFVCLFFFLIGCEDSPQRLIPIDEPDDGNSEITDDSDNPDTTPDPADSDNPDTTPDPADSDNPDTTPDPTDPTNPDPTNPDPTDPTNPDPTDPTNPDPTDPTTDPTDPTGDTCYSAVFNGSTSKIEVAHDDALNLSSDTWTIEAWIKQTEDSASETPIVAKKAASSGGWGGNNSSYTYSLSNYYITKTTVGFQQKETTAMKGAATYSVMNSNISAEATELSNSKDWTHIALVQTTKTEFMSTKPMLTLYINGSQVKTGDLGNVTVIGSQKITVATSTMPLLIGSGFKGLIDSIKISSAAKYSADFEPKTLSVDNDTIALWDFNGSADDYEGDMTSTPTDITYSTDCKK